MKAQARMNFTPLCPRYITLVKYSPLHAAGFDALLHLPGSPEKHIRGNLQVGLSRGIAHHLPVRKQTADVLLHSRPLDPAQGGEHMSIGPVLRRSPGVFARIGLDGAEMIR
jgi:hypothetical protein